MVYFMSRSALVAVSVFICLDNLLCFFFVQVYLRLLQCVLKNLSLPICNNNILP